MERAERPTGSNDQGSYPRLRPHTPLLRRGPDELQIGLDQEPALVLGGVGRDLGRVLTLLDGCHHLRDIYAACARLDVAPSLLDWAIRTLGAAGLLVAPEPSGILAAPVLADRRIRLIGAGSLGRASAGLLVHSGVGVLHVVDGSAADPALYPAAAVGATQAEALQESLCPSAVRVSVTNHWSKPDGLHIDLTIVATDMLESDRVVTEGLVRADEPHLLVRSRAGGAVVGPLVIPGQTACLRCTDLTRRDADDAWPTLLLQLARIWSPPTPAVAGWAGGVAATQSLAFLQGRRPETFGATIEMAAADLVTRWRSWSMHAGCGCGWGATAQWGT